MMRVAAAEGRRVRHISEELPAPQESAAPVARFVAFYYEPDGSECRTTGTVGVAPGAWWAATLTVPLAAGGTGEPVAFLHVERAGPTPAGYRGGVEAADLSAPAGELDALLALLAGVVAQARRDGVLPGP